MNKISKKRKTRATLALLCALTLTGCENNTVNISNDVNKGITFEEELSEEENINKTAIGNTSDSTTNNEIQKPNYTVSSSFISISKDFPGNYGDLLEEDYEMLNEALKQPTQNALVIERIDDEVDFSKLNLDNINWVEFRDVGPNFPFNFFHNKAYNFIEFSQEKVEDWYASGVTDLLKNSDLTNAIVELSLDGSDSETIEQRIIDGLADCEDIGALTISTNNFDNLDISNLKSDYLCIYPDDAGVDININATIHNSVKHFSINYYYPNAENTNISPIIKSIKINSGNKELISSICIFSYKNTLKGTIDENIEPDIDSGCIMIQGIDMTNLPTETINKFRNLKKVFIYDYWLESEDSFHFNEKDGKTFDETVREYDDKRKTEQKKLTKNR